MHLNDSKHSMYYDVQVFSRTDNKMYVPHEHVTILKHSFIAFRSGD